MKRAGPDFCWLGLGILVALLVLAASGAVMREGDQAFLLEGSVEIARSWNLVDRPWYNYDKQFLSYWFLAAVFDITAHDASWVAPSKVVELGNLSAALFFSVCLLTAFVASPRRNMSFMPVLLAVVLTPALVFSLPLLASNIFSAGTLLLLAAALRRRRAGIWNALLCGLLTAAAVGFRSDAALVLPALCLLSTTRFSVGGLLRELRHWIMAAAAIGTVAAGHVLGVETRYQPDLFFDPRLFGAYLVFGMAGSAVLLFWLPLRLVASRRRWFLRSATALSILLPFAAYSPVLYTPRHFLLATLILLLVLLLPRGAHWWRVVLRGPFSRTVAWSAVVGTAILWIVGARFESTTEGRVVLREPTLYPTADGFWPMGCYQEFFVRLSRADETPIDHNQEVWEAWTRLSRTLPVGEARVRSSGLRSLGQLVLRIRDVPYVIGEPGDYDLVCDRSLGRARPGFYREGGDERKEIDWQTCWLGLAGGSDVRKIYWIVDPAGRKRELDLQWVAQLVMVETMGADDFHIRPAERSGWWEDQGSKGHRLAVIFRNLGAARRFLAAIEDDADDPVLRSATGTGVEAHVVSFVRRGVLPLEARDLAQRDGVWMTRSLLPAFMSRSRYRMRSGAED